MPDLSPRALCLLLNVDPPGLIAVGRGNIGEPYPAEKARPKVTTVPKARCSEDAAARGKAFALPGTRH